MTGGNTDRDCLKKRRSDKQITKDDADEYEEGMRNVSDGFQRADEEVIKSRKMYKVKRNAPKPSTSNPFAATASPSVPVVGLESSATEGKEMKLDVTYDKEKKADSSEKKSLTAGLDNPVGFGGFGGLARTQGKVGFGGFGGLAQTKSSGLAFGGQGSDSSGLDPTIIKEKDHAKEFGANQTGAPHAEVAKQEEIVTGEENEKQIFCCDASLFEFESGSWKERGIGALKVNCAINSDHQQARVVMRQKGNLKLLLNANLWDKMQINKMEGGKGVSFACLNHIKQEEEVDNSREPTLKMYALRIRDVKIAAELFDTLNRLKCAAQRDGSA